MIPDLYVANGNEIRPDPITAVVIANMLPFKLPGLNLFLINYTRLNFERSSF
jgi:hypothetical protein